MVLYTLFFVVAAAVPIGAAALAEISGLSRLHNVSLAGRAAAFPSTGIRGVNLGSWFVFGVSKLTSNSCRWNLSPFRALHGDE
jgi:hypothetical protein